jgi:hypothetical protein
MYQLKGFIEITSLINNTVGTTAPFGELSTWGLTYTKEKGEYTSVASPGFKLNSISSVDSVTGVIAVTAPYSDHVLQVAKWIADYGLAQTTFITRDDFRDDLLAEFTGEMSSVQFGDMVSNGSYSVPAWISWSNPTMAAGANQIKIWFANQAFLEQFDEFSIVVIPPLANLDDMFLAANVVRTKIEERTFSQTIDAIQTAKNKNPETVIRNDVFTYSNPTYPGVTVPTSWSLLIYGLAGDNVDSVKDAIITYILANSSHTREEWTVILPDLFKRTEFLILPAWNKYAIPNMSVQEGVYSPIVNIKEAVTFMKTKVASVPAAHIDLYMTIHPCVYRSVALLTISNPDNRDSLFELNDVFPDFIDVGTGSTDFNRMALATREWSSMIENMVIAAEEMTTFNDLPVGMRRLTRDGILYVARVYDNIQYMVAGKINYPT